MTDMFGKTLHVGDKVVFPFSTKRDSGRPALDYGIIKRFRSQDREAVVDTRDPWGHKKEGYLCSRQIVKMDWPGEFKKKEDDYG